MPLDTQVNFQYAPARAADRRRGQPELGVAGEAVLGQRLVLDELRFAQHVVRVGVRRQVDQHVDVGRGIPQVRLVAAGRLRPAGRVAMVKPAVSPLAAGWVNVVHPAGSGRGLGVDRVDDLRGRAAGGSVARAADEDEPSCGPPAACGVLFSSTTVAAPAAAPSTASTTSPIFHHSPDRRRCGVPGWNSGHEPGGAAAGPARASVRRGNAGPRPAPAATRRRPGTRPPRARHPDRRHRPAGRPRRTMARPAGPRRLAIPGREIRRRRRRPGRRRRRRRPRGWRPSGPTAAGPGVQHRLRPVGDVLPSAGWPPPGVIAPGEARPNGSSDIVWPGGPAGPGWPRPATVLTATSVRTRRPPWPAAAASGR